jgi:hypothetical protein
MWLHHGFFEDITHLETWIRWIKVSARISWHELVNTNKIQLWVDWRTGKNPNLKTPVMYTLWYTTGQATTYNMYVLIIISSISFKGLFRWNSITYYAFGIPCINTVQPYHQQQPTPKFSKEVMTNKYEKWGLSFPNDIA